MSLPRRCSCAAGAVHRLGLGAAASTLSQMRHRILIWGDLALRAVALAAELSRCVFAGLTNGFGGVRSEQEPGGLPGRKATPRRRCASESSIASSSSPLCDARWVTRFLPRAGRGLPSYGTCLRALTWGTGVKTHELQVLMESYLHFSQSPAFNRVVSAALATALRRPLGTWAVLPAGGPSSGEGGGGSRGRSSTT